MTMREKQIDDAILASIIVLTKNGEQYLREVLSAVFDQDIAGRFEVLVIDSGSDDATLSIVRSFPKAVLHQIRPEEFGHGATRNLGARLARGEFLVFIPQDATPCGSKWLASLLTPFCDASIAGVYGRQVPRAAASSMEAFMLQRVYPDNMGIKHLSYGESPSFARCFFSTVSGAIRASVWRQFPFREDIIMSEDQAWSRDVMTAGHGIAYAPMSRVWHSHLYRISGVFRRNFDSGYSMRQIFGRDLGIPIWRATAELLAEARFVLGRKRIADVLMFLPYEAARHTGFWLGLHGDRLPHRCALACSSLRYFWLRRSDGSIVK